MTCTLSGRFVEFGATFTHADVLGGALTSLIETVNTHLLIHDVLVDQPGRDGICDFLAYEGQSGIKVFESNNLDSTVVDISETVQVAQAPLEIHVTPDPVEGFVYAKINDPFKGRKILTSVRRSDGKQLPIQNGWLSKTWDSEGRYWHYFVNFFDATEIGLSYQLFFSNPEDVGNQPPVLGFIGDKTIGVGQQLGFLIQASDPNTTIPSISSGSLPLGGLKSNGTVS